MEKVGDQIIVGLMIDKIAAGEVVDSVIYNIKINQLEDSKLERVAHLQVQLYPIGCNSLLSTSYIQWSQLLFYHPATGGQ